MGHTRLGRLPRTRKWQDVIGLVGAGFATADIAAATLDASKDGLEDAARDPALLHSFWLLTQIPLCARRADFVQELAKIGVSVANEPSLMELVGGLSDAVDAHVYRVGGRTDLGEMAQMVVARDFFARLTERYLTYFLSRELSNELESVSSNRQFREALSLHCKQASKIVEQFAAEWFSKANYQGGITPRKAAGFISHAMTKLGAELQKGAEGGEG
jgi:hypothetical protein